MKPVVFLTKFEAAVYLCELYQEAINTHGLPDKLPNFYSFSNENRRIPAIPEAIRSSNPHGNRGYYSTIPTVRLGKQVYFIPLKLEEWLELHFLHKKLEAA